MYTIYHIEGIKVGCSKRVEKRVKQQGYNSYEVLEICSTLEKASEREIYWQERLGYKRDISSYKNTRRMSTFAHTLEAKSKFKETIKISEAWKEAEIKRIELFLDPEVRERARKAATESKRKSEKHKASCIENLKKAYTPEAKSKFKETIKTSEAWKEAKRKSQLPEIRARRIAKIKKPILQYDLEGNFIKEWPGVIDAERELGIFSGSISTVCKGKQKTAGKFIWKYKYEK